MTTFPRLASIALLAGLVAACSSGGGHLPGTAGLTVEQLSARVGCAPRLQAEPGDVRTGHCRTPDGAFSIRTFASRSGRDAWMADAPGPYLAGDLWTVLSRREVLGLLQERLGGDLYPHES